MNKLKTNQSGFGVVEGLLIVVILVVLGVAGWFIYKDHHKAPIKSATGQQVVSDGSVSISLKLDKYKVTAGSTISGTVNIINQTAKPLSTGFCAGDGPLLWLQTSKLKYLDVEVAQVCEPTRELNPGNNVFSIQISTLACNYVYVVTQPGQTPLTCTPTHTSNLPNGVYEVGIQLSGVQGIKHNSIIAPSQVTLMSS